MSSGWQTWAGVLPPGRAALSFFGESILRMDTCWPSAGFIYPGVCRRWELEALQKGGSCLLIDPAFAALLSVEHTRGSGLWEEEGPKLFIALKTAYAEGIGAPVIKVAFQLLLLILSSRCPSLINDWTVRSRASLPPSLNSLFFPLSPPLLVLFFFFPHANC